MCVRSSQRPFDPEWHIVRGRLGGDIRGTNIRKGRSETLDSVHREERTKYLYLWLVFVHAYKQAFPRRPSDR